MSAGASRDLAVTARFTAAVRAQETLRPDALFQDPWAAALAGDAGFAWLNRLPEVAVLWPTMRTRFLDECLAGWRDEAALAQVVLVAAGLDTRAYRLRWPTATVLYELDQPALLAEKDRILTAADAPVGCRRVALGCDLRAPWDAALIAGGFDPGRPATWLIEGLLLYLDADATRHLMAAVAALAAPGSRLGLDVPRVARAGQVLDDPAGWLAAQGWDADVTTLADAASRYRRWPYAPPDAPPNPSRVYFIAARR